MVAGLPGRRFHHALHFDPRIVAYPHLLGCFLLSFRFSCHLDRLVRPGSRRSIFVRSSKLAWQYLFQAGNARCCQQLRGGRVPDLHPLAHGDGQPCLGRGLFRQCAAILLFRDGCLAGCRRSDPARGPRLFLRSARRGGRMPCAGSLAKPLRRPKYSAGYISPVRGVGSHLVQPGWHCARARCGRGPGSRFRGADRLQLEAASHRYSLCQGNAASQGTIRTVEQFFADRVGDWFGLGLYPYRCGCFHVYSALRSGSPDAR